MIRAGVLFVCLVFGLGLFLQPFLSHAAVTREFAYQGKLMDATGAPVTDGPYDLTLTIYDAASGGTNLWTTTREVTVTNGIFSLMLGDTTEGDPAITLDFNTQYWLGVTIESDNEMTPRKKMGSTPSAVNSDLLDGLNSATSGTDAHIVATNSSGDITSSGDLGVNGGDITSTGSMTFTPSAGTNMNIALSGTGDLAVNTNQLYVDTSSGYVGIGTTSPSSKLDIFGTDNSFRLSYDATHYTQLAAGSSGELIMTSSATTDSAVVIGNNNAVDQYVLFDNDHTDYYAGIDDTYNLFEIGVGSAVGTNPALTINSSGYVGIGTTSANEIMDVNGRVYLRQTTAPSTTTDRLYNVGGSLYWNGVNLGASAGLPSGTSGQTVYHNGSGWVATSNLFNDGTNVGIGTTNPTDKLMVYNSGGYAGLMVQSTANNATLNLDSATDNYAYIGFSENGGTRWTMYNDGADSDKLKIGPSVLTTYLTMLSGGNVGIGTTSPNALLHLSKDGPNPFRMESYSSADIYNSPGVALYRSGGTASSPTYPTTGDRLGYYSAASGIAPGASSYTGMQIFTTEDHSATNQGAKLVFRTIPNGSISNAERMVIDQNGSVGIGTTNPLGKLHVSRSTVTTPLTTFNELVLEGNEANVGMNLLSSNTGTTAISFGDSDDNNEGQVGYNHTNDYLYFSTNDVRRLAIDASGNVGIGTTSTSRALHVYSTISTNARGAAIEQSSSNTAGAAISLLKSRSGGSVANGDSLGVLTAFGHDGTDYIYSSGIKFIADGTVATGSVPTALVFSTGTGSGGTENMRITSGGNVGIGTTSPNEKLTVNGNISFEQGANRTFSVNSRSGSDGNGYAMTIKGGNAYDSSGYSTGGNLYLTGGSGAGSGMGGIVGGSVYIYPGAPGGTISPDSGYVILAHNGTSAQGNVGIGTTTPNARMEVYGDGTNSALFSNGNVGIGTTSPEQKLHLASAQSVGTEYESYNTTITSSKFTGLGASDSSSGGNVAWAAPTSIYANDTAEAAANFGVSSTYTYYLKATTFGFAVPAGATITGVEVSIDRFEGAAGSNVTDREVKLVKGGTIVGNNKAATTTEWPVGLAASAVATYGGATDLWGTTLTSTDVNSSNFGVVLSVDGTSSTTYEASVDYISIKVFYTNSVNVKWVAGIDGYDNGTYKISNSNAFGKIDRLTIDTSGNVDITGTLRVNGSTMTVPDYVFEPGYELQSLEELEAYVNTNYHLPGVMSRAEIQSQGLDLGGMMMSILEKTEENSLYIIQNHKDMLALESRFASSAAFMNPTGNVGIGIADPTAKLFINASDGVAMNVSSLDPTADLIQTSPGTRLTADGRWMESADESKHSNIVDLGYGLDDLVKLRPVSFTWNTSGTSDIGFVAQEVKQFIPELVSGEEGNLSLSYSHLTALAVKAIQEQQRELDSFGETLDSTMTTRSLEHMTVAEAITTLGNKMDTLDEVVTELEKVKIKAKLAAVETDLTAMPDQITALSTNISNLNQFAQLATEQMANHETRIMALESEISGGSQNTYAMTSALTTLASVMKFTHDEDGSLVFTIDGDLKAEKVGAKELELGENASGTGLIKKGERETQIFTTGVSDAVKIYITPKGRTYGKTLYYDSIESGKSFIVRIDEGAAILENSNESITEQQQTAPEDIHFNWMIVK